MLLRLLVAVDDSPYAIAASERAINVAVAVGKVELTALHVVNVVAASGRFLKDLPGRLGFEPAVVGKDVEAQHDEEGRQILGQVKVTGAERGVEVRTVLDHGAVTERILHHAEQSDLLFIGNKGLTETRFPGQGGGHVYNLVAGVSVPVILVPTGAPGGGPVVIGYDGSLAASRALAALRRLGGKTGGAGRVVVHAVFVDTDGKGPGQCLDQVAEQLPMMDVIPHVVAHPSVSEALARVAEEVEASTLVLGFRGNSRLHDFFYGASAEFFLSEKRFALLIAP